ncbi:MAG: TIGR02556 family CRISPR-associated protein [Thermocrinis sp.]|jgi:CRISPR-associated protein Csh1|uniref:TIGR02556 family CRISPR-associated protein n=1 Tax=Thermocrinis sp. TaxID=2024383 RepID=UPI003C071C6D
MLRALKEWGELFERPIYDKVKADKVIVLEFELDNVGNATLKDISLEEFSEDKLNKYLYRRAKSSNPPTYSPTLHLSKNEEKSLTENIRTSLDNLTTANNRLKNVPQISIDLESVAERIRGMIEGTEKSTSYLLTIRFNGKYIGEMPEYIKAVGDFIKKKSYKKNGICSICGEEKKVSKDLPFKFLTYDKPGYIVGGFREDVAYKNSPICFDCYEKIRIARQNLESATFKLASTEYMLIPETLKKENLQKLKELFEYLRENNLNLNNLDKVYLYDLLEGLVREEDKNLLSSILDNLQEISGERGLDILSIFRMFKDIIIAHFLFIKRELGREAIELYISDVFPSRIYYLFKVKEFIEELEIVKNFDYGIVKKFFKEEGFYQMVEATFWGKRVENAFLCDGLMNVIRESFKEWDKRVNYMLIRKALAVYLFVRITTEGLSMQQSQNPQSLEEFFVWVKNLPSIGSEDWKYGLVLMGFLTEYLLEEQRRERGSKPFLKKLKSLKMDWGDIVHLLPELRQKLEEYEVFDRWSVRMLFGEISYALLQSTKPKASVGELNFYFVSGMGLYGIYRGLMFNRKQTNEEVEE